eukprot:CAMPEP_0174262724 /NCGR_PEP_ID=MMETSP0439-20130205/14868_1 /TAXON_ID=0 /ORGANISM="Stereomyxa ramosa, Strain Chinc5" /LENGTH=222 /DNA_ID=CAMNT_0015347613 /DNA_START=25 /DNA_END=690 /DNA_ORIENTATION=-
MEGDDKYASKYFDKKAGDWDHIDWKRELDEKQMSTLKEKCPELFTSEAKDSSCIMDFGCGTGAKAIMFAQTAKEVVAVDTSQGMLDQVKTKAEEKGIANITPILGDILEVAASLSSENKTFDLIFSSFALHHIEDPVSVFSAVYPLLKSGGKIVVFDLLKTEKSIEFHSKHAHAHAGVHHHGGFTIETAEGYFANCSDVQVSGFAPFSVSKEDKDFDVLCVI